MALPATFWKTQTIKRTVNCVFCGWQGQTWIDSSCCVQRAKNCKHTSTNGKSKTAAFIEEIGKHAPGRATLTEKQKCSTNRNGAGIRESKVHMDKNQAFGF